MAGGRRADWRCAGAVRVWWGCGGVGVCVCLCLGGICVDVTRAS